MNATQQFYALVATRFIELKQAKLDRAEIICNVTAALDAGEIDQVTADSILAEMDELK